MKDTTKRALLKELKIFGIWIATYLVLMVILLLLAVLKVPSEGFVRTFVALLPLVLLSYPPYLIIKCVILLTRYLKKPSQPAG